MRIILTLLASLALLACLFRGARGPVSFQIAAEAACQGDVGTLRAQLARGVDQDGGGGPSLLMYAALNGELEAMGLLLQHGGAINQRGPAGWTPLMYAVLGRRPDSVRALLRSGADAGIYNDAGLSALELAHGHRDQEIIQILTEAKHR